MQLTPAQIWDITAEIFHHEQYCQVYTDLLSDIIGSKEKSILDTACGTGFPSINLAKKGYKNLTCLDSDEKEIRILKHKFEKEKIHVPVIKARWQSLKTNKKFDAILNADNSLPYMDSWNNKPAFKGEKIFGRLSLVINNFYKLLGGHGALIIGIAKNNVKENSKLKVNVGSKELNGKTMKAVWELEFDWKNRIKTAKMQILANGETAERVIKSYLFTKEELTKLLLKSGFGRVKLFTAKSVYDDILVAYK